MPRLDAPRGPARGRARANLWALMHRTSRSSTQYRVSRGIGYWDRDERVGTGSADTWLQLRFDARA
eukprot:COSAG02_NODE_46414_length_349_cov_0.620000_1_plen_65_part_01